MKTGCSKQKYRERRWPQVSRNEKSGHLARFFMRGIRRPADLCSVQAGHAQYVVTRVDKRDFTGHARRKV